MKTTAIKIEGNLISPELFDGIDEPGRKGQTPQDFGIQGKNLRDVISNAWSVANYQWNIYKAKLKVIDQGASGTEETRKYWIIPLLEEFGFSLEFQRNADVVDGKTYMITHRDNNLSGFPLVIMGWNDSLDKKRSEGGGSRLSPHALVQEYINIKEEYLYGIVTNGKTLRILRDSVRMVRLSYLEFDLELMMENQLFAEFAIMFRILHASRMPKAGSEAVESLIEEYHLNAIESGSRIRENLSAQMKVFIQNFGNGILRHPGNEELRSLIRGKIITADEYYEKILRLIYRILFLMVTEERGILFPGKEDLKNVEELKRINRFKEIYSNFYSMTRIRRLSERKQVLDPSETDLFASLINSFRLFEDEKFGLKLGIKPLGGSIFSENGISLFVNAVLDNGTLLDCFDRLNRYYDKKRRIMIRVNYAALNVEEFGSVYEELLEYKGRFDTDSSGTVSFALVKGDERSSSGSHYTPEELVQPLIKHSLEYLITDKVKGKSGIDAANSLLTLKVCDPACGSGHVLLSVARRLAFEVAKYRTGEDQPTPLASRVAIRDVISKCIHGVDKNPMAVELCKVALWLESYNPGLPLNYLDEKIKLGDSVVGFASIDELKEGVPSEAFKPGKDDDKALCTTFRKSNELSKKNRSKYGEQLNIFNSDWQLKFNNAVKRIKEISEMTDDSLESIARKEEEYRKIKDELQNFKDAADFATSLWFVPKTETTRRKLGTEEEYFSILSGNEQDNISRISSARGEAAEKRFFHWFIEFPDVIYKGGFDLVIGNPPFLHGQEISGTFGPKYFNNITTRYFTKGNSDLVVYFFLRSHQIIGTNGFQALISTNSISQGNNRISSLQKILGSGAFINFAYRNIPWPGRATVTVSLVVLTNSKEKVPVILEHKIVNTINSNLEASEKEVKVYSLKANENLSFQGTILVGEGFILDDEEAKSIVDREPKYKDVVIPLLHGNDVVNDPECRPSRWVINFNNWEEEYCQQNYPVCFSIVESKVKPDRTRKDAKGNFVIMRSRALFWWQFGARASTLYSKISSLKTIFVATLNCKHLHFVKEPTNYVYTHSLGVFAIEKTSEFAILNNSIHENWAWITGSALGASTLRYTSSTAFETYPFPDLSAEIERVLNVLGQEYYDLRESIKLGRWIGITDTYNLFHNPDCRTGNLDKVAKLKTGIEKELTLEQAVQKIEELRAKRVEMEKAVLAAYGWSDIDPGHDFHEVDYLPEKDRIRFTISPAARREVLDRLMALNHARRKEEEEKGLWPKKK